MQIQLCQIGTEFQYLKLDGKVNDQGDRMDKMMTDLQANRINETALLTELRTDMRYLREAVEKLSKP